MLDVSSYRPLWWVMSSEISQSNKKRNPAILVDGVIMHQYVRCSCLPAAGVTQKDCAVYLVRKLLQVEFTLCTLLIRLNQLEDPEVKRKGWRWAHDDDAQNQAAPVGRVAPRRGVYT